MQLRDGKRICVARSRFDPSFCGEWKIESIRINRAFLGLGSEDNPWGGERRIAEGLLGCDHPLLVSSRAAEDVLYFQARGFSPVDVGGSLSFFLCQSILPPGDC